MACALTQDISLGCRDSVGGIETVYITELANKATLTTTAGTIGTFTLSTGKQFWIYELVRGTANWGEDVVNSEENGTYFYQQKLAIKLHKRSATLNEEIKLIAQNRLMIIVKQKNGEYYLIGEEGATLDTSTFESGTAMGDFNGYTLNFKCDSTVPAAKVNSNLISTLTAPAA